MVPLAKNVATRPNSRSAEFGGDRMTGGFWASIDAVSVEADPCPVPRHDGVENDDSDSVVIRRPNFSDLLERV